MISVGNVIVAAISTGLCTMWAGWAGLFGSIFGHVIYYMWIKEILFG